MDIGKLLLLGGAGYLAYQYFGKPTQPTTTPGGIQPTAALPPLTNSAITYQLMKQAASRDGFSQGTIDQWNYFYSTPDVRGIAAPDPVDWGFDGDKRNLQMTLDEWWSTAEAHGLAGLRGGYLRAPLTSLSIMEAQ